MKPIAVFSLIVVALCAGCHSQDSRLATFEKFNHASTYEQARPLVSGVLAVQLDALNSRQQVPKALSSLHLLSYDPRIVDIDENTSFLVLDNVKSDTVKQSRQTYLLSRDPEKHWTLANRLMGENVLKSLWTTHYSPSEFNQPSQCSMSGKDVDASLSAKDLLWQSAVAIRHKDTIEIRLFPFPISQADLDYLKLADSGVPSDSPAYQNTSLRAKHPECRIVVGLTDDGRIHFLNVGFNDPASQASTLFQGQNWASLPPSGAQTDPQTGLPPEFKNLVITKDRIRLESAGELQSAGKTIRWSTRLNLPLWQEGL
jgi:hypothetical protein